ncbi:unnamed protein product [Psylliodes chrysocephalus]|uniref:Uncharacterized protein n=1 Tax=Psylliodes chrysocephalus TaxID=3402493 RepID=A0A9P0GJG2_9CUCU|nr:unnamed protein product [Psylliodes chrysocephala]
MLFYTGAKEYKKGGGKEHHSSHKGEKGEKGDKGYKGHHYNEKGEKGHKTKEDHDKEYEEKGGHKKKHHHDDGYAAEHHQGEKGHKSSKYHENGDHSKGHSTKGEHIIHKKDEYDKRQEFYDESHEEDGFEKDGEYFHESDYKKGGHEKGGFVKGGEESAQHGKKHHYDKGGHYKEGKGHKGAAGHDSHYDHEHKKGEKEDNSGGKKWSYSKGDGGGGGGGHKHSGKYEHADSVNIPIRVVQPIIRHKDNDVQSNIPKLVLEEDVDNFKQPDVIYPPLTPHEFVRGQRRYDEDRIVISKPNHKKIVDERINIQRRNDEVDDANYEDEIINPELERKQAHTKDHSIFRSVLNRSTDNKIVDEADKKSKDLNTETTKFKSINSDYLDEYDLLDDKKNDEVGVYSVYTLGDYRVPAVPKIQPTTGTEGYEKLKDVAITSDSAEYSSSEETTTQNLQEELNRTILTDDDVDASKKVSKNIHDTKEIGPITAVSKDVEDIEEDEELRNVKDTDDNEELRNVKDTDDGEELTNVGDTKVLTASMEPIVVGDEVEEESEN